jgi:3-demethoxyubiquinol 3-hydroxylase
MRNLTGFDNGVSFAGRVLAALAAAPTASRPNPAGRTESALSDADQALSGALMRVNHVGEVCAQALYEGQAMATRDEALRKNFRQAAREEGDHLAWTRERLTELGARPSLLNPLWFGGSFLIGALAGRLGDTASLGFMEETERQVEQHLAGHLESLPLADQRSRQIVSAMQSDEAGHARAARSLGAERLPLPARLAMRAAAKVMTATAYYL